jgi:hypothetical protein
MDMCCDVTSYINSTIIVSQRERIKLCHKHNDEQTVSYTLSSGFEKYSH